jgi:hypothetical protein
LDASIEKTNEKTASIRKKLKRLCKINIEMDQENKILQQRDPKGNDTQIRVTQVI